MEGASAWATLAIVAALGFEKILLRMNLYDPAGVKSLHCGCSKCMEFDVQRQTNSAASTPKAPTQPPPSIESFSRLPSPSPTPTIDELVRRLELARPAEVLTVPHSQ